MDELVKISAELSENLEGLDFTDPVAHVYRPVNYAWPVHRQYLERFGAATPREVLLVGMNPGPWGMGQTGVPFGDVDFVTDWMGLDAPVEAPAETHPKKPVDGLECERNEVSGSRLWGWARDRYGEAEQFFERFYVHNYCPLLFLKDSGRNCAPSRMRVAERQKFIPDCDGALLKIIEYLRPRFVVGVGNWARDRVREALEEADTEVDPVVGGILHPSPASPKANQGWAEQAEAELADLGVEL